MPKTQSHVCCFYCNSSSRSGKYFFCLFFHWRNMEKLGGLNRTCVVLSKDPKPCMGRSEATWRKGLCKKCFNPFPLQGSGIQRVKNLNSTLNPSKPSWRNPPAVWMLCFIATLPRCPLPPEAPSTFLAFVLTISQMGKGTLRRMWELSEVTDCTPVHQRMEYSQGSFTV